MAKEFAKRFYSSTEWKKCRKSYISKRIAIDGGLCETCKENQGYIVHHKTELSESNINDPNITLSHENLSYECKKCHDRKDAHLIKRKPGLLCTFDSDGQPIPLKAEHPP